MKKNSFVGKGILSRIGKGSGAYILPFRGYRRSIAYMNELYEIAVC
jgi:hypothetical protein